MISMDDIKNMFGKDVFQRGLRLLDSKNTLASFKADVKEYPLIHISVVFARYGSIVRTRCDLNEEDYHLNVGCSCMNFMIYRNACEHTAAAMILYVRKRDAGEFEIPGLHDTTPSLAKFMNDAVPTDPYKEGTIHLEPHVTVPDEHSLTVFFRICRKTDRLYQLRDVNKFLSAIENKEEITYGKNLSFIGSMEVFENASRPLVRFLQRLYKAAYPEDRNSYYTYYGMSSRTYSGTFGKELSLYGIWIDEFLEAARGQYIFLETGYDPVQTTAMKVELGEPKLSSSIEQNEYGWDFSLTSGLYAKGSRNVYFFEEADNTISCLPLDKKENREFVFLLDQVKDQSLHIGTKDIRKFTQTVYPIIEPHTELKKTGYLPEAYLPPKASFDIYLDLPQDDIISGQLFAVYGERKYNIYDPKDKNRDTDERNALEEKRMEDWFSPLFTSFSQTEKKMMLQGDDDAIYHFLTAVIPELQQKGNVYISDALKKLTVHKMGTVSFGVSVNHDLLQLHLNSDQRTLDDLAEIMSRYSPKKKYYRLKNGAFVTVDDAAAESFARMAKDMNLSSKDIRKGDASIPKYRAMYLDEAAEDGDLLLERDEYFSKLVHSVRHIEDAEYEIPSSLNGIMRPYQKDGYRWLRTLQANGFGALLADEMGLGKSLQTIALILSLEDRKQSLIICPASLVYNWNNEFEKFAPGMHVTMITGSAEERAQKIMNSGGQDILVSSYDAIKRDIDCYKGMHFSVEIIDEAQYIKNASTLAAQAVKEISAGFRIALTGTPIENRLAELWSIFDYLMPGFLYGYTHFRQSFETPIVRNGDKEAQERLRSMISPFVLRRLKEDVLKDLPPKLEEVYYAPLEGEQKELYEARVQRLKISLAKKSNEEFKHARFEVLAELTRLRELCCAPSLVYDNYRGNSAKEDLCLELIERAVQEGHKILLFSSFTSMLYQISRRLSEQGISYYLLEGKTPKKKRIDMVEEFQEDETPVFLISLKAGGTGLNLTAADIVIHYDPWWNTAVENQASDRAHRIGQDKPVSVYRLITKDTVEERILKLQAGKSKLAENILSGDEFSSSTLTKDQLMSIL